MPQVFFKHFTSKSQPPGLSRSGTLVENRLNSNIVRIARMASAVYLRSCHIFFKKKKKKKKKKEKKRKLEVVVRKCSVKKVFLE